MKSKGSIHSNRTKTEKNKSNLSKRRKKSRQSRYMCMCSLLFSVQSIDEPKRNENEANERKKRELRNVDAKYESLEVSMPAREMAERKKKRNETNRNHLCKINKYTLCFVPLFVCFWSGKNSRFQFINSTIYIWPTVMVIHRCICTSRETIENRLPDKGERRTKERVRDILFIVVQESHTQKCEKVEILPILRTIS